MLNDGANHMHFLCSACALLGGGHNFKIFQKSCYQKI